MYLRHSTVRKNGKTHVYWRVVRSVRRNGKVVQETVAQLGELDAEGRALIRNRVDVGRFIGHHPLVVGADVPVADVVSPDDEDVGFVAAGATPARAGTRLGLSHLERIRRCLLARVRLLGLAAGRQHDGQKQQQGELLPLA